MHSGSSFIPSSSTASAACHSRHPSIHPPVAPRHLSLQRSGLISPGPPCWLYRSDWKPVKKACSLYGTRTCTSTCTRTLPSSTLKSPDLFLPPLPLTFNLYPLSQPSPLPQQARPGTITISASPSLSSPSPTPPAPLVRAKQSRSFLPVCLQPRSGRQL